MIKNRKAILCLVCFLFLFGFVWQSLKHLRKELTDISYIPYTAPSRVSVPASLEFKGIVSDFFFLKMITSIGEKIGKKEMLDKRHADYIYQTSDIITDLDPYFWDPYIFGDMILSWGFGDVHRANQLLLKAQNYRPKDFRIPYYVGFNYFYFLKDNLTGSRYLMEASRYPGCPSFIPALAARLSVKAQEHQAAIMFLEDMIKKTQNEQVLQQLRTRLDALVKLHMLETKIHEFKDSIGRYPKDISELLKHGLIKHIPKDPYGGQFYLTEDHRVFTTSELRFKTKPEK